MKSLTLFRNCILVALLVTLSSISAFSQDMFAPPVNYATGDAPFPVFSIDFNSDGNNDLVTANTDSHNVTILLGNGDGTFQGAVNYAVGYSPISVFSIDFNGDGDNDLASANRSSDNVSILLGNGDGTFQSAVNYAVGGGPRSVFSIDFDGDGDNDLATANFDSDDVSILLNLTICCNGDGLRGNVDYLLPDEINIADLTYLVAYLFTGGAEPPCIDESDIDGNGEINIADLTYLVSYLFTGGIPPVVCP